MTKFVELARVLDSISSTTKRSMKTKLAADFLRLVNPHETSHAALFMSGRIFAERDQRVLNISWRGLLNSLSSLMELKDDSISDVYEGDVGEAIAKLVEEYGDTRQTTLFSEPLTIDSVWNTAVKISEVKGKGSQKERESLIASLFVEASPREARYLSALFLGDMRTGLSEGLLAESIAVAFEIDPKIVRRAWSFIGDLGEVARLAVQGGSDALIEVRFQLMHPMKPMLASPAEDASSILENKSQYSFEMKLDGARVQIHKQGSNVKIFSRRLLDVTESLPDIVALILDNVTARSVVFDGEVLAVDEYGKPYPFQVVMTRFGRTRDVEHQDTKLKLVLFDILLLEERNLVDRPYTERRVNLEEVVPAEFLIDRLVSNNVDDVNKFFRKSRELGHEGLVAKSLDSLYEPGVRGKHWFKIKHTLDTMDLVIIAAEWGHGRRSKWLSDYHLAVRDENTGEFVMIGKTYKGLTDVEFENMTEDLKKLELSSKRGLVKVKPEKVVEVLAAEIQESPTYSSGYALRFARIINIREDKGPEDVMTLGELEKIFEEQFRYKAR